MASVEVKNVKKTFGKVVALNRLSFKIEDAELFGLLAPPGAGKTTVLRIIAGLERPEEGEVLIGGHVVNDVPPQLRDVAMVFEDVALYPHLTGFENIAYPLRLRKLPRSEIERRVKETAKLLHVEHLLGRKPNTFSGGERRRVAIARALVRRPRVLLLDQPFTDLDAKIRQEMTAELKKLQTDVKQTMVLATHDFEEAMIADRIAIMHNGEIQQIAPPREVYDRPATTFVAEFVGSPAMNLFECRVETRQGGTQFLHDGFTFTLIGRYLPGVSKVVLGIRPEKIVHVEGGPVRAQVEVIQVLGEEGIVDLKLPDGTRFKWLVGEQELHMLDRGMELPFVFPSTELHFYDGETGVRLCLFDKGNEEE